MRTVVLHVDLYPSPLGLLTLHVLIAVQMWLDNDQYIGDIAQSSRCLSRRQCDTSVGVTNLESVGIELLVFSRDVLKI